MEVMTYILFENTNGLRGDWEDNKLNQAIRTLIF